MATMTTELKGTSSKDRTLDEPTLKAMRPAAVARPRKRRKKAANSAPPKVDLRVKETRLNDGLLALARRLSDDDPSRVRVHSPTSFSTLSVPWKEHPTGHARVVGEAPGTGTIRRYKKGRLIPD
jgi:hypothetical protein